MYLHWPFSDRYRVKRFLWSELLNNFLTTAVGLAFTLFVCLYVAYALLGSWLHMRRTSEDATDDAGEQRASQPRGAASAHTA